ncbi:MAG: VWA domain-containing protein [Phycisphaerales bacterium]
MEWALVDARWLALGAVALPCALIAWRWFNAMSTARRVSAVVARAALLFLIAAMLAGLSSVRRADRVAVVGVIDLSGSVARFGSFGEDDDGRSIGPGDAARAFLSRAGGSREPDDLLGVVTFDGRALAAAAPARADVLDRTFAAPGVSGTDLESAVRLAAGLVPPDSTARVVVFTDGNETAGDAVRAAAELAATGSGVTIDVVPVAYRTGTEVVVESLDVPARSGAESTVPARVVLRSTGPARGTLRLTREGEPVDADPSAAGMGRDIQVGPGRTVVEIPVSLPPGRVHRFEAVYEPELDGQGTPIADRTLANNRAGGFTLTPGRGSVLLVDGVSDAGRGGVLARTLREQGVDVTVVAPAAMPTDVLGLQSYDLAMLENVPAEEIGEFGRRALVSAVRDLGVGLVMVGGPDSFGAGGWKGTLIEPILPVALDIPDKLLVPEAAVVFVLDKSGSMGRQVMGSARSQQSIANESAALAVDALDERDLIGVVSFNNSASLVVPLRENSEPERTQSAIRSIGSGGGTNLPPALRMAREQLQRVEAKIKHVIVLSDGQSQDAPSVPMIAEEMRREGITVSTIAVGDGADTATLSETATRGGGAFYAVSNPNVLPRVFLKAVRVVRSPLVREGAFTPALLASGSPMTEGLGTPPELGGLVLTRARPEPGITYAMASSEGEPLLAHWQVGLGQVVAFTSDAEEWADAWLSWDGYRVLWTNIARQAARAPVSSSGEVMASVRDGELSIRFEAFDETGAPLDGLTVPVTVYGPAGGEPAVVRLRQTAPGVYEGATRARDTGSYVLVATPARGGTRLSPAFGGASLGAGAEYARVEPDAERIAAIARAGGGRVLDPGAAADLFDRAGVEPRRAMAPLWPVLMWWALLVFMIDVGTRRIAWDRLISQRFGADWRAAAADAVRDRSSRAQQSIDALRGSKREPREPVVPTRALGADDAARVAAEQRRARVQTERDRLDAIREKLAKKPTSDSDPAPVERAETPEDEGGLLAAKRRARERYRADDEPAE